MDVLFYDTHSGTHYKAVAKPPVRSVAEEAATLPGNILVSGVEMGGGSLSTILQHRAQEGEVVMSASSATTVHHDIERVRAWGISVVEDREAERLLHNPRYHVLTTGDLEPERLHSIVKGFGIPFSFDVVGVCAQDHGVPPAGLSHLDYRHSLFKPILDDNPFPHAFLYKANEVPRTLTRLRCIAESALRFTTDEAYVIDSGMAAILGASMDPRALSKERVLIVDVATSHTLGAALKAGEIAGYFEYHTHAITPERLDSLLIQLADGELDHTQLVKEGGHGAYVRHAIGSKAVDIIVATGPKRGLLQKSRLPIVFGAPLGDNMMTGTVGVLEAIRRCKGLAPIVYV
jgi:uncharacterized protein (DUF1786 family)